MQLTKNEKSVLKYLLTLKTVSMIIKLLGLASLFLGIYAIFFRSMSPEARSLNFTLVGYSVGIFILGCLLMQAYSMIGKLQKKDDA